MRTLGAPFQVRNLCSSSLRGLARISARISAEKCRPQTERDWRKATGTPQTCTHSLGPVQATPRVGVIDETVSWSVCPSFRGKENQGERERRISYGGFTCTTLQTINIRRISKSSTRGTRNSLGSRRLGFGCLDLPALHRIMLFRVLAFMTPACF